MAREPAGAAAGGLVVICCASADEAAIDPVLDTLRREGHTVELLGGVETFPERLEPVLHRLGGEGLYVLCRSRALPRDAVDALRDILLANHVPFGRTLTVASTRPQELRDRIVASMGRVTSNRGAARSDLGVGRSTRVGLPTPVRPTPSRTVAKPPPPPPSKPKRRATVLGIPAPKPHEFDEDIPTNGLRGTREGASKTPANERGQLDTATTRRPPSAQRNPSLDEAPTLVPPSSRRPRLDDSALDDSALDDSALDVAEDGFDDPLIDAAERDIDDTLIDVAKQDFNDPRIDVAKHDGDDGSAEDPLASFPTHDERDGHGGEELNFGGPLTSFGQQDGGDVATLVSASSTPHRPRDAPALGAPAAPAALEDSLSAPKVITAADLADLDLDVDAPTDPGAPVRTGNTQVASTIPRAQLDAIRTGNTALVSLEMLEAAGLAPPSSPDPQPAAAATPPPPPAPVHREGAAATDFTSSPLFWVAAIVGAVLLGGVVAAVATGGGDDKDEDDDSTIASATLVDAPSEDPNASPAEDPKPPAEPLMDDAPQASGATRVGYALRSREIRSLDVLLVTGTAGPFDYDGARQHCDDLDVAGLRSWRVPEVGELRSLTDARMTGRGYYWSATPADTFGDVPWVWYARRSRVVTRSRDNYVVCVRGGAGGLGAG